MKCSACKNLLAAYLDGDLSNGTKVAVAGHLAGCARCSALAERMRFAEARLSRMGEIEPRADFTNLIMARVAALPAPKRALARQLWWVGGYLAAGWALLALALITRAVSWRGIVVGAGSFVGKLGVASLALYRLAEHFHLFTVAALGVGIELVVLGALAAVGWKFISRFGASLLGARL